MVPNFYYHPRMLAYDFGLRHPLRPERLQRTVELLETFAVQPVDPGPGDVEDALRVHSAEYIEAVQHVMELDGEEQWKFGFSPGDTPPFLGMLQASLAYLAGSIAAARNVADGAQLAFSMSGGLHHAQCSNASGFCVFNDCAAAISVLLESFARVAYVDIDLHHGDGVQNIFFEDPRVLTCSIHQDGRTLYPGTGFVHETGAHFSSLNVPLWPGTTGDVWLRAFRSTVLPVLDRFEPEAIVLQMGVDSHYSDPLGHLQTTVQEWLGAVADIGRLGVPIVALGGGGYDLKNVPRMWTAGYLTLVGCSVPDELPSPFGKEWGTPTFNDPALPEPRGQGSAEADRVVAWIEDTFLSGMASHPKI